MGAIRRVEIELNSTGDNPVIDHQKDNVLHCGNFQVFLCNIQFYVCNFVPMCIKFITMATRFLLFCGYFLK